MSLSRRGFARGCKPSALGRLVIAATISLVPLLAWVQEKGPQSIEFLFPPHGTIRWERGGHPVLLVRPIRGDGWITLARRYTGTTDTAGSLHQANPGMQSPMRDRAVLVPLELLRPETRLEAVQRLFPADVRTIDELARIAEHYDRVILRVAAPAGETYIVDDGVSVYRYVPSARPAAPRPALPVRGR